MPRPTRHRSQNRVKWNPFGRLTGTLFQWGRDTLGLREVAREKPDRSASLTRTLWPRTVPRLEWLELVEYKPSRRGGAPKTLHANPILQRIRNSQSVRDEELEELEAVISLPSSVIKPYADASTAILVFSKGGQTDHVFFYDVQGDGLSLDDKREPKPDENELLDALEHWRQRSAQKSTDLTAKHSMVPVKDIVAKDFDLSINRDKETRHEEVAHKPPQKIIARLRALATAIAKDLKELEAML
jgi:hypothetical protein